MLVKKTKVIYDLSLQVKMKLTDLHDKSTNDMIICYHQARVDVKKKK